MSRTLASVFAIFLGVALVSGLIPGLGQEQVLAQTTPQLVITNGPLIVTVGETITLTALNNSQDVTSAATWRSRTTGTVESLGGGRFRAEEPGAARVSASYGGTVAEWRFVVLNGNGGVFRDDAPPAQVLQTLLTAPLCSGFPCTLVEPNFLKASYSGAGHFIISGEVDGQGREGVWAFTESGQAAGIGNLMADIGKTVADAHSQTITPFLQFNGTGGFVHSTDDPVFNDLPLTYYEMSGGRLSHRSQAMQYSAGTSRTAANFAVANNHVIVNYSSPNETVTYSLPAFTEVRRTGTSFVPITGAGNFMVAAAGSSGSADIELYRIESDGRAVFVEELQELNRFSAAKYDIDHSANPLEINFLRATNSLSDPARVTTYRVTADGFDLVGEETFRAPSGLQFVQVAFQPSFAVSGNFAAFAMSGAGGFGVGIYENGNFSGFVPNPFFLDQFEGEYGFTTPPATPSMDISPSGKMVITSHFGARLYQVGVPGPTPGGNPVPQAPGSPFPVPGGPQIIPGQTFEANYGATSTAPSVLARFTSIMSISPQGLRINVFGQVYDVRLSANTQVLNSAWAPTTLAEFQPGGLANVWGTLDPVASNVIHALTLRNPSQVGARVIGQPSATGAGTTGGNTAVDPRIGAPGTGNAASLFPVPSPTMQNTLNSLQSILNNLLQRLAQ